MIRNPCVSIDNQSIYSDILHDIEITGYRYVILTICLFGIICNILNLCVLLQRRLKESPYTYLTGLAIADMLTLILISPFSIVRGDYIHHENMLFTLIHLESEFYMPLGNYFGQVSIMITLALTIERYLFTTYPLRTRSFCKPRYARIIIMIILFICAILSFPRFLFYTVEKRSGLEGSFNSSGCSTYPFLIYNSSINSTDPSQCFCIVNKRRETFASYENPYYITMLILNQILPAIILFFLNFKLIRRVQHSNRYTLGELVARQHRNLTLPSTPMVHPIKQKRLREEHRLTKTLVAVILVFLVCNTFTIISYPHLVIYLTKKRYPNYYHTGFRIQKLITNIMLLLNYSVNFFFYCAFNQKFLDTLKSTFHNRLCSSYFSENSYHQSVSPALTQRKLFNSTTFSFYSQSKTRNSTKRFSNSDEDYRGLKSKRKDFSLTTFKDNDANH
jgi:hypothetical protein